MMFDAVLSNFKSSSMVIKESDDLPIIPTALIDKLTKNNNNNNNTIFRQVCLFSWLAAINTDLFNKKRKEKKEFYYNALKLVLNLRIDVSVFRYLFPHCLHPTILRAS